MKQLLLLAALPGALLAQALEGSWQGTLTPPNQNDGIRRAFKTGKNGNTYQRTFYSLASAAQRASAVTNGADALPDLFTAFQEQLGLKLDATKALAEVLVIDKVSKPSEN